jgi:hypothetical protein
MKEGYQKSLKKPGGHCIHHKNLFLQDFSAINENDHDIKPNYGIIT